MKTFVVAGTYEEAQNWIAKNYQERVAIGDQQASTRDYKYIFHADDVKGYTNPHGVFVGNWLGRPDIFEVVEALMMASVHVNPALGRIYNQVKPKIQPAKTYTMILDEAAEMLSKSIDAEVLKSLMKTTGV